MQRVLQMTGLVYILHVIGVRLDQNSNIFYMRRMCLFRTFGMFILFRGQGYYT